MSNRDGNDGGVVLILGEDRFLAAEAVRAAVAGREATRYRGNEIKLGAALDAQRVVMR